MQRKHTTTACLVCRESKTKCDGVRPICSSCAKKKKSCEYSTKDDKRKLSLRTAVEMLFGRVEQLTLLANKHNLEIPPMSADEQSLLEQVCVTLELPVASTLAPLRNDSTTVPAQASTAPTVTQVLPEIVPYDQSLALSGMQDTSSTSELPWEPTPSTDFDMQNWTEFFTNDTWSGSPSDWPWQILNDFSGSALYTTSEELPLTQAQQKSDPPNEGRRSGTSSEDEVEADIVPRLAARFGSLRVGADGQLRYYGTASNYHFISGFRHVEREVDLDEINQAAHAAIENAGLDQEPPESLQNHLIELFATWHNPSHMTVDMDMFNHAYSQSSGEQRAYCSPSLINAMCAIGAAFEGRYHQSFITFPKPLADFFAERSRIFLEFEFDSPCLSTVQALLLLSSHEAGAGRDGRMWLYSGMAMRLAFDVGLHVDSSPYVKQGMLTAREAEVRRTTFWSCVSINQLWSFSLGRPFRVDSEEITVTSPIGLASADFGMNWNNFTSDSQLISTNQSQQWDKNTIILVANQWAALCEELAPLVRILYGCIKISKSTLQKMSHQTTKRLEMWQGAIPHAIKIHTGRVTLPHVLLLHMAYHNFCILIHRPWTSKGSQPDGKVGPGHQHARDVCRRSASEIASLLRDYESNFSFKKMNVYVVNIIFSASLILIFGLIAEEISDEQRNQTEKANVARDLNTCFRALDELGHSFESAKRNHEYLLAIQAHWSRRKRDVKAGAKRKGQQHIRSSSISQKRIRSLQN